MTPRATHPPVIGLAGASGSGKTLLLERLIPLLKLRGLRVGVIKHCPRHFEVDRPGKDTERLFRAGADVLGVGRSNAFERFHESGLPLPRAVRRLACACDLCFVEGYHGTELPHLRILDTSGRARTGNDKNTLMDIHDLDAQLGDAERAVWDMVASARRALPVSALVLVGGRSRRMGRPKALLERGGETLVERAARAVGPFAEQVVLGGRGSAPESLGDLARLPDAPGAKGPLAGMLSAFRWEPLRRWIVLACDLAWIEPEAVGWLVEQDKPGCDAVLPVVEGAHRAEPLFALYAPTARPLAEDAADRGEWSVQSAMKGARVRNPTPPARLSRAWTNVNTPEDWDAISRQPPA